MTTAQRPCIAGNCRLQFDTQDDTYGKIIVGHELTEVLSLDGDEVFLKIIEAIGLKGRAHSVKSIFGTQGCWQSFWNQIYQAGNAYIKIKNQQKDIKRYPFLL